MTAIVLLFDRPAANHESNLVLAHLVFEGHLYNFIFYPIFYPTLFHR